MWTKRFFFGAMLLLAASSARGDWQVVQEERHAGRTGQVVRLELSARENESNESARLQVATFRSKDATLRVVDQPTEPRATLAEAMGASDALAGVNGGYFDPEYAAVGLLISDGRVVQAKQRAKLLSGVVSAGKGRILIQRASAFSPKSKPTNARQCGPFLVEGGQAIAGLNDTRWARRTFVATLAQDRVALGYCSSVTLAQLAALLAASDLKVQSALNLDGGSSSGFWFAGEDGPFSIREQKTVRDYLAIVPRR